MFAPRTPLLQCYLSRFIACFSVFFFFFCNIQCQFSTCKAKGLITWLSAWGLEKPALCVIANTRSPRDICEVLQAFRPHSLSFVHRDIDKRHKDMRWPEQRPDKVSAQFTWRDKERLGKRQHATEDSYLPERKACLKSFKKNSKQLKSCWELC